MDLIVDSESGSASSTDILNCADSLRTKKLKKKETEQVLNKFVQDKWLNEVYILRFIRFLSIVNNFLSTLKSS